MGDEVNGNLLSIHLFHIGAPRCYFQSDLKMAKSNQFKSAVFKFPWPLLTAQFLPGA